MAGLAIGKNGTEEDKMKKSITFTHKMSGKVRALAIGFEGDGRKLRHILPKFVNILGMKLKRIRGRIFIGRK